MSFGWRGGVTLCCTVWHVCVVSYHTPHTHTHHKIINILSSSKNDHVVLRIFDNLTIRQCNGGSGVTIDHEGAWGYVIASPSSIFVSFLLIFSTNLEYL